mgnify:CR=1 FL=1
MVKRKKISNVTEKINKFLLDKRWHKQVCYSLGFPVPTFTPTRKEIDYLKEHTGLDPFVLEHLKEIKSKAIYGIMQHFKISKTSATEYFNLWFVSQIESKDKAFLRMRKKVTKRWKDFDESD